MRLFFSIFFIKIAYLVGAQTSINSVLVLGDSYLKGHFGSFLQKEIHDSGKYDVLSIAIGGAGSETFLPPMKNKCCGYRVRQSCAGIELEKTKHITEVEIPILEKAERPTNNIVMGIYGGDLYSVMEVYKPLAVILVLGTNKLNAHDELLTIIKSYDINMPIIWIGPFDKNKSKGRYISIKEALKNRSNSMLVKSDSIVSKLGFVPSHFHGIEAKKLAKAVFVKFESFLDESVAWYSKKFSDTKHYYLPEFLLPQKVTFIEQQDVLPKIKRELMFNY